MRKGFDTLAAQVQTMLSLDPVMVLHEAIARGLRPILGVRGANVGALAQQLGLAHGAFHWTT